MKKIKVLFTIPNFDTAGSGKALLNLALGLDASQFEAEILCLHNKGVFFKEVEKSNLKIHVFNYLSNERPYLKLFKQCWAVSRKLKKINPDIIHSFNYSSDYTEAMAAKMAGIPWVFTKKNMGWFGPSIRAWKLRSLLAHKIVIQNTDMQSQFYVNSNKTRLIPRGVNTAVFCPGEENPLIRTQLKTQTKQKVILCVANFVPVKGIELLIQAFKNIEPNYTDWVLWLVGDINNDYGKSLVQLVNNNNLQDKIHFSGKQPDVLPYLRCASLFVLPTKDEGRREGSPVALLEAMATGVCVIGSKVPGIKDQLKNFENHLFEANNALDLQKKLTQFMALPHQKLKKIGEQFKNHASKQYTIAIEINKHQAVYNEILKR